MKLHRSQPRIVETKMPDESIAKSVVIGKDGLPEVDESVVGVSFGILTCEGNARQYIKACVRQLQTR